MKVSKFFIVTILAVVLNSCGAANIVLNTMHEHDELQKNPSSFVGKYFEVAPRKKFAAANSLETILELRKAAKEKGLSANSSYLTLGSELGSYSQAIQNLNVSDNKEDENVKLLFQVVGYKSVKPETFVQIKTLNKKYCGTTGWITSYQLIGLSDENPSPFVHH